MDLLMTCKTGFEKIMLREAGLNHFAGKSSGPGWVLTRLGVEGGSGLEDSLKRLCFACEIQLDVSELKVSSVNQLASQLLEMFFTRLGSRRIEGPWYYRFVASGGEKLIQHTRTLEKRFMESLRGRMARVAKLGQEGIPYQSSFVEGIFVHMTDFNCAQVSFRAASQGQRRMKMDPQAPSRSYLKMEEALHVLDCEPQAGELVVDLGAAPGGWSHSALRRGAKVIAVDNGPLKEPVRSHPHVRHLLTDALKFQPPAETAVDWLFCDMLEQPDFVLNLLGKWLDKKWCRRFVINLKVGRLDPIVVLKDIYGPRRGLLTRCRKLLIRQLYHDREEITLMGQVGGG